MEFVFIVHWFYFVKVTVQKQNSLAHYQHGHLVANICNFKKRYWSLILQPDVSMCVVGSGEDDYLSVGWQFVLSYCSDPYGFVVLRFWLPPVSSNKYPWALGLLKIVITLSKRFNCKCLNLLCMLLHFSSVISYIWWFRKAV